MSVLGGPKTTIFPFYINRIQMAPGHLDMVVFNRSSPDYLVSSFGGFF